MEIRPVILERKNQGGHGPGLTGPSRHCKPFEPNLCTRILTEEFEQESELIWLKFLIDHSDCCVKNRPCRARVKSPDQFRSSWRCHPGWTWERLGAGWGSRNRKGKFGTQCWRRAWRLLWLWWDDGRGLGQKCQDQTRKSPLRQGDHSLLKWLLGDTDK